MQPLIFTHANSFPAGTYRLLFALLRARGFDVQALERVGHDTRYPVTDNWPHLVQQLADFAAPLVARWGQPAYFVGHSLGGYLSVMTAAQYPELARGVLMLDSPLLGGWRGHVMAAAKYTALAAKLSPGKISHKRRNQWPSRAEALALFQDKPAFARWHPQVLNDYVDHGLETVAPAAMGGTGAHDGPCALHFTREQETAIYNTLPHNLPQLLRRHPLQCPAAFIGGRSSTEVRQVGMGLTRKITHGRTLWLDGSHLFPMELPWVTAAAIEASLLNLDAAAQAAPAGTTTAAQKNQSSMS